jgi:replicative DNA helicase
MNGAPICDVEMERGVLGGVLLAGTPVMERLIVDVGLHAEHFYWRAHQLVFVAMLHLQDRGAAIDVHTVTDQLRIDGVLAEVGGAAIVDALAAHAPAAGDSPTYGECVVRDARRRTQLAALEEAKSAVLAGDETGYARAEAKLMAADGGDATTWDREATREHLVEYLAGTDSPAILTPFPRLNDLLFGGVRRGDTTLVGGWSSHGKSTTVDGCLDCAAEHAHRAHLYLNEMSLMSRALRTLASLSGVSYGRLLARELDSREHDRVLRAIEAGMPWGMSNVAGWAGSDICRHMIARAWDAAGLDSINLVQHHGTEGIDELMSLLCSAAQRANTHLWIVCQLNKARAESGVLPLPVERDVRESGKLVYDCSNLLFVHRDQQEVHVTGEVRRLNTGALVLAKARNGELGKLAITLNPQRMRWIPELEIPEVAAA